MRTDAVLRSRALLAIVVGIAAVLAVLALAQVLLPGLAADRVRSRLARDGIVDSVQVRAFPAIELLWGKADSVDVRLASLHAGSHHAADLLASSSAAHDAFISIGTLTDGPLALHDVVLRKHADRLSAQAGVTDAALRAALPPGLDVAPVASGGGQLLLRAKAGLLGVGFTVDALLSARDGALVITPVVPFGGLITLNVFSDPRVAVQGVGAATAPGGFTFNARGRLTG